MPPRDRPSLFPLSRPPAFGIFPNSSVWLITLRGRCIHCRIPATDQRGSRGGLPDHPQLFGPKFRTARTPGHPQERRPSNFLEGRNRTMPDELPGPREEVPRGSQQRWKIGHRRAQGKTPRGRGGPRSPRALAQGTEVQLPGLHSGHERAQGKDQGAGGRPWEGDCSGDEETEIDRTAAILPLRRVREIAQEHEQLWIDVRIRKRRQAVTGTWDHRAQGYGIENGDHTGKAQTGQHDVKVGNQTAEHSDNLAGPQTQGEEREYMILTLSHYTLT